MIPRTYVLSILTWTFGENERRTKLRRKKWEKWEKLDMTGETGHLLGHLASRMTMNFGELFLLLLSKFASMTGIPMIDQDLRYPHRIDIWIDII